MKGTSNLIFFQVMGDKTMCQYSFIIPVYNVKPDFLEPCIASILANDFADLEIILVDDGSVNGCEKFCDEYAVMDNRIRVFHQRDNMGVSAARNLGIAESAGEWVVFVDSDDWVSNKLCGKVSGVITQDTDIILFSAYRESVNKSYLFGTSDKKVDYLKGGSLEEGQCNICELSDNLLKQSLRISHPRYETVKYCWGKAFRKEFIVTKGIKFPDINYCEDIVFMADVFQKAEKVIQISDRLYHYRVSETSVVNSFRNNALFEQRKFLELLEGIGNTEKNNNETIYYAALLSMQICITRYLFNKENKANIFIKHKKAMNFFREWPYSNVFRYVDCANMKINEKIKAILIKYRLYYLYYLGTEAKKAKTKSYV